MRINHRTVQGREDGHPDYLLLKAFYVAVMPHVTVVRVPAAIPIFSACRRIEIDEVVHKQILPERSGLRVKCIRLRARVAGGAENTCPVFLVLGNHPLNPRALGRRDVIVVLLAAGRVNTYLTSRRRQTACMPNPQAWDRPGR
ncbi:MAG TPA: hypothetical protein VIP46_17820 [Pyrinomonadaceae bacterium]